ncbi:MAG: nucleotidyltransferase domain-containing protein [Terriglobia bacterium]
MKTNSGGTLGSKFFDHADTVRREVAPGFAVPIERHPHIPQSAFEFLTEITRHDSVEALILFGSRAFGDHEDRSDVDVAVCGVSITPLEWSRIRDAASTARSLYWISLVHFERNPPTLKKRITDTGIQIYVRPKTSR